jgi:hypothetical protein
VYDSELAGMDRESHSRQEVCRRMAVAHYHYRFAAKEKQEWEMREVLKEHNLNHMSVVGWGVGKGLLGLY